MAAQPRYNLRSPAVRRLMREAIELRDPTPLYHAQPLEENLFEWHFTIRGPPGTDYEGGRYHGRILLPPEYPMKPPSIIIMTPNGRFELNYKICLSASSYHPELWQASWGIRTMLLALIGFMPTDGLGSIGSLNCPAEERRRLARRSLDWVCPTCGSVGRSALPEEEHEDETVSKEMASIVSQMAIKTEAEVDSLFKKQKENSSTQGEQSVQTPSSASPPSSSTFPVSTIQTDSEGPTPPEPSPLPESAPLPEPAAVRQRSVPVQATGVATASQQHRVAEQGRETDRDTISLVVIFVLVTAICLLLARRLFFM